MLNDRHRILELALEALELKKKKIEEEIAEISQELKGRSVPKKHAVKAAKKAHHAKSASKHSKFTEEEKLRRSQRMKEYWKKRHNKESKGK